MNVRKIFENYILSWFVKSGFDYDRLLDEPTPNEYIPLLGKFDYSWALGYYKKKNTEEHTLLGEYLYRFKYHQDEKCGQVLASCLKQFMDNNLMEYDIDITTIVPMTLTGRMFKIMEYILTQPVVRLPGSFLPRLLVRRKITGQAKEIRGVRRKREVVRNLYKVNENFETKDKNILIFDDIYDSGATLNECARILKEGGANNVMAITLVKTRRGQD
jgi:competence protein ComFC